MAAKRDSPGFLRNDYVMIGDLQDDFFWQNRGKQNSYSRQFKYHKSRSRAIKRRKPSISHYSYQSSLFVDLQLIPHEKAKGNVGGMGARGKR